MVIATPNLAALYVIFFLLLGKQPPVTSVSDVVGAVGTWDQALARTYGRQYFPRHRRVFVRSSLVGLLQFYGFHCEKVVVLGFPPLPWFAANLVCRLLPMYAWIIIVRARKPT
jgi:hypothetical protein